MKPRKFVYFDAATGRILASGMSAMPELAAGEAAVLLDVAADPKTHYVDLGTRELRAFGPRPDLHAWDWTRGAWVPDPRAAWAAVRRLRNQRLAASDWTQLPDAPVAAPARWAAYRQALRDITQQTDPLAIDWPEAPQ